MMERREFIITAALSSTAGCIGPFADNGDSQQESGDGETGEQDDGGPEETVTQLIQSLDDGDLETVNGMLHPDGNLQEIPEQQAEQLTQSGLTVEETEVIEETEERAVVRATVTAQSPEGQQRTIENDWELRLLNGQWRVWDGDLGGQ